MIKEGVIFNGIVIAMLLANAHLLWWRSRKPRSNLDTLGVVLTFLLLLVVVVFPTFLEAIFVVVLQIQLAAYVGRRFGWRRPDPSPAIVIEATKPKTRSESLRILLIAVALVIALLCLFGTPGFGWITDALQVLFRNKALGSLATCLIALCVFVGWPVVTVADYIERRFWLRTVWALVAMGLAAGCMVILAAIRP